MNATPIRIPIAVLQLIVVLVLAVAGCRGDGVMPGSSGSSTGTGTLSSSAISSTSPANGASGIGTNAAIAVNFSAPMTASSINNATMTVTSSGLETLGNITYDSVNNIAMFTPSAALLANTVYTVTLTTGVEDATGNALAVAYTWSFTTAAGVDSTAPLVTGTNPASGGTGVALNSQIAATFSKQMNSTLFNSTSFQVTTSAGQTIAGAVTYSGYTAVFTPSSTLPANTQFNATIAGTVTDLEGNFLSGGPFSWSFTTSATSDFHAPTVSSTSFSNAATGVALNQKLAAFFSKAMNPATVNTSSFTLMQGTTPVPGTVSYIGGATVFSPSASLLANSAYTATISSTAKDLAGNAIAGNYVWTFNTGSGVQNLPPTISATVPAASAVNVSLNAQIAAMFSETMDPTTVTTANFTLQISGVTPVTGTVSYVGTTAIFSPLGSLLPNTQYTATITTVVRSLGGAQQAANYSWNFYTGATVDSSAPVVAASVPATQATGVATNGKVSVSFNKFISSAAATNVDFTLNAPGAVAVPGLVNVSGNIATFAPTAALLPNTAYQVAVGPGIQDLAGNAMAASTTLTFTTGSGADTTLPTASSTYPSLAATGVYIDLPVSVAFSKPMDPTTISASTIAVAISASGTAVPGTVSYYPAANIATFVPALNLATNTNYTATVGAGVMDLEGNALVSNKVWSFATGATASGAPPAVNLGSLGNFAVVAGAGLTNANGSGETTINGNVGLSPTATCYGDGSPCSATDPVVNGTLYANDANGVAATAKSDLANAYGDASGRASTNASNGLLARVFTPGVYASATNVNIAAGTTITLDAQGNPNAIWIFQLQSSLAMGNSAQISLINGARAANVYWAIAGPVTMGTGVGFQGTVLSPASIAVGAGSTIYGRLLCSTGSVALLDNTVTVPGV